MSRWQHKFSQNLTSKFCGFHKRFICGLRVPQARDELPRSLVASGASAVRRLRNTHKQNMVIILTDLNPTMLLAS